MKKIIPIIVIIMSSTAVLSAQDFRYDAGIAGGISWRCQSGFAVASAGCCDKRSVPFFVELSVGCKDRYFSHAVFRRYP